MQLFERLKATVILFKYYKTSPRRVATALRNRIDSPNSDVVTL